MMHTPTPALRTGLLQKEVAAELGVTVRTLSQWAKDGFGPEPTRDGNRLLYCPAAVAAFKAGARA